MKLALALLLSTAASTSFAQTEQPKSQGTQSAAPQAAEAAKETKTVEGPIAKVVPKKKEIYVQGADKKHEFYFKPNTELTKGGQPAEFSALAEGMRVRVTYVTVGKRTDPVKVEILQ